MSNIRQYTLDGLFHYEELFNISVKIAQ